MTEGENINKAFDILSDLKRKDKIDNTELSVIRRALNYTHQYGTWTKCVGGGYYCSNCLSKAPKGLSKTGDDYYFTGEYCSFCGAEMEVD